MGDLYVREWGWNFEPFRHWKWEENLFAMKRTSKQYVFTNPSPDYFLCSSLTDEWRLPLYSEQFFCYFYYKCTTIINNCFFWSGISFCVISELNGFDVQKNIWNDFFRPWEKFIEENNEKCAEYSLSMHVLTFTNALDIFLSVASRHTI